jgi:hypothetical protein
LLYKAVPFVNKQPLQGFSAIADTGDGSFMVMADNGYGAMENSLDFDLRQLQRMGLIRLRRPMPNNAVPVLC